MSTTFPLIKAGISSECSVKNRHRLYFCVRDNTRSCLILSANALSWFKKKKTTFLQVLGFHIASHIWRYWPKAVLQNEKGSPWWKVKHECQCWVFAATTHPSWIYLELFTFVLKQVSLWAQSFQFCSYVGCFFFFCSALHTPKKHLFSFLFLYLFKGHKHLLLCHIHLCLLLQLRPLLFSLLHTALSLALCPESRL